MKILCKKIIIILIILLILCPSNILLAIDNKKKNEVKNNNTLEYTEEYKRYLELSDEEKAKISVIPRMYNVPIDVIYEDVEEVKEEPKISNLFGLFAKTKLQATDADELPEKYNLADHINILVENQKFGGLCWNFASLKSLETYLSLNGYGDYDFSERHLDFIESEEFKSVSGANRKLNTGGNFVEFFQDYINRELGPVLEKEVPFDDYYSEDEYDYLYGLTPKAYVNEVKIFPAMVNSELTEDDYRISREQVKKHIMKNGSVYAVIKIPEYNYNEITYSLYSSGMERWRFACGLDNRMG